MTKTPRNDKISFLKRTFANNAAPVTIDVDLFVVSLTFAYFWRRLWYTRLNLSNDKAMRSQRLGTPGEQGGGPPQRLS